MSNAYRHQSAAGYNAVTRLAASDAQERGVRGRGKSEDPETRTVLEKHGRTHPMCCPA